jgi:hypothetical protein
VAITGCQTEKCECTLSKEQLDILNGSITEWEEVFGYDWNEELSNSENKAYEVQMNNWFTNYMKTYKLVNEENSPYLETSVSIKYLKQNPKIITSKKILLSQLQWDELDNSIESKCLWTEPINFKLDTNYTDYLTYDIECFNPKSNPCTKNKRHMIRKQSRTDSDIKEFITLLLKIDPMNDLDTLNKSTYPLK